MIITLPSCRFLLKTVTPHENMEMGFDVLANASKMIGFARTLYTWNVKSGSPQIDTSTHGTLILRKNVSIKDLMNRYMNQERLRLILMVPVKKKRLSILII